MEGISWRFCNGMNEKCGRRSGSMGFKESDMHEGL